MKKRTTLLTSLLVIVALAGSPDVARTQGLCEYSPWVVVAVVSEEAPFLELLPFEGSCRDDALKAAERYRKDNKNPIDTAHAIPVITYCALLIAGYTAGDPQGCPTVNP